MLQKFLEAEIEASIGYPKYEKEDRCIPNMRNGYSLKTVKSQYGEIPLEIPPEQEWRIRTERRTALQALADVKETWGKKYLL